MQLRTIPHYAQVLKLSLLFCGEFKTIKAQVISLMQQLAVSPVLLIPLRIALCPLNIGTSVKLKLILRLISPLPVSASLPAGSEFDSLRILACGFHLTRHIQVIKSCGSLLSLVKVIGTLFAHKHPLQRALLYIRVLTLVKVANNTIGKLLPRHHFGAPLSAFIFPFSASKYIPLHPVPEILQSILNAVQDTLFLHLPHNIPLGRNLLFSLFHCTAVILPAAQSRQHLTRHTAVITVDVAVVRIIRHLIPNRRQLHSLHNLIP